VTALDEWRHFRPNWVVWVVAPCVLALGLVILRSGIHLLQLKSRTVALVGSIATIYLGILTLWLLGAGLLVLPGGIWATRLLCRKNVKAAFATGRGERDLNPAELKFREQMEGVVFGPALWLLNAGGLLCLAVPVFLLVVTATDEWRHLQPNWVVWVLAPCVLALGLVILRSGIHLLQLKSRTVALVGSISMIYLGILTIWLGVGVLFLVGGIWATRVLRQKDVKSAFAQ
jgi:hypothetical protein